MTAGASSCPGTAAADADAEPLKPRFRTVRWNFRLLPRFICRSQGSEPIMPILRWPQAINHDVIAGDIAKPAPHRYGPDAAGPARAWRVDPRGR